MEVALGISLGVILLTGAILEYSKKKYKKLRIFSGMVLAVSFVSFFLFLTSALYFLSDSADAKEKKENPCVCQWENLKVTKDYKNSAWISNLGKRK